MSLANDLLDCLLQKIDQSNWPEMKGEYFKGYSDAMEEIQELVMEFQGPIYKEERNV